MHTKKIKIISYLSNPNGPSTTAVNDWPLYTYPKREHIVLDLFNKSTGIAHRADYCAFWEDYIPILLEEFGKYLNCMNVCLFTYIFFVCLERCVIHGPSSSLTSLKDKSSSASNLRSLAIIFVVLIIITDTESFI